MGKAELGMKLTCESCGARFYDLNKTPATCPKCGASNSRPTVFKSRRNTSEDREEKRPVAAAAPAPEPEEEEDIIPEGDEDEEDEAVIEDTSDLGEDDDVEVVVEEDRET